MNAPMTMPAMEPHVPETAFGKWFLQTNTWTAHVLDRAMKDLDRLIPNRQGSYQAVADVGCGWGRSLKKLNELYAPERLIGIDIDPEMLEISAKEVSNSGVKAKFIHCASSRLSLPDNSVDVLFCHQTFRHPMKVQKTAPEYLKLVRDAGFQVATESISYPFLWSSRADLGIGKKYFGAVPPVDREETLISLVAVKPWHKRLS